MKTLQTLDVKAVNKIFKTLKEGIKIKKTTMIILAALLSLASTADALIRTVQGTTQYESRETYDYCGSDEIVVSKSEGYFDDPVDALHAISYCASADNPYVIKILPGVYDIGSRTLYMERYVDIEGSGENTTVIKGSNILIRGNNNAEIRSLTLETTGSKAIYNYYKSPKLTNITVKANEGSGVFNYYSKPIMTDVSIIAYRGVHNSFSYTTMNNVTIKAKEFGVLDSNSNSTITNSRIDGSKSGIQLYHGSYTRMNNVTLIGREHAIYASYGSYPIIEHSVISGHINGMPPLDSDSIEGSLVRIANSRIEGNLEVSNYVECIGVYNNQMKVLRRDCSLPPGERLIGN